MNKLAWNEFAKVDMRVGTILEVLPFPKAKKPAYQLHIDFGEEVGILKTSAQITKRYLPHELLNRQVVAVINFPPKQIANFMSECLVLGAVQGEEVILLQPGSEVPNGLRIS
ncbi:MAG: tRNA-binding protein [Sediminicola sp.]|tara:strand:+ start:22322 stop:22657 length:336 start_codon:yes stop_codon:yes gene_type:complete